MDGITQSLQELLPGRTLAAPSWVFAGSLVDNCVFLAGKVDEVGLLFFQSAESLSYTDNDLPASLASLPLRYHVHLPADLDMHVCGAASTQDAAVKDAGVCAALFRRIAFLGVEKPVQGVLHPPKLPNSPSVADLKAQCDSLELFLHAFKDAGYDPARLMLENIRGNDLSSLKPLIKEHDLGVCLDLGHLLAYGQQDMLDDADIMGRVRMLHLNAPGEAERKSAHRPLTCLDAQGRKMAERVCKSIPENAIIMMELFSWEDIVRSMPLVRSWLLPQG